MATQMKIADPADQAPAPAKEDRRRPLLQRTDVMLRANLHRGEQPDLQVRLRNISPAGFMAECLAPVEVGSNVVLSIPGVGRVPAEIRWNVGFRFGGMFHYEMSARELGLILDATADDQ